MNKKFNFKDGGVSLEGIKTVLKILRHSTGRERHVLARVVQKTLFKPNTLEAIEEAIKGADEETIRDLFEARGLLPMRYSGIDSLMLKVLKPLIHDGRLLVKQLSHENMDRDLAERLMENERVHKIANLNDLDNRLKGNRIAFGLFHPLFDGFPAVVCYVALTQTFPKSIQEIFDSSSNQLNYDPKYAVFYSISNMKNGLKLLKLGRELIYGACHLLTVKHKTINNFQTLSPIHGFRKWYEEQNSSFQEKLQACEDYLTKECLKPKFKDPVCLFHKGNGAILDCVIPDANPKFWQQSFGMMASYKYELAKLNERRISFQEERKAHMKGLSKL